MRARRLAPFALLASCGTGQEFNPPKAPSMEALLEAYEEPTGTLTPDTAVQVAQGLIATAKDIQSAALLVESVTSAIGSLEKAEDSSGADTTSEAEGGLEVAQQGLTVDYWMRATWICTGWVPGDDAPVDEKWGDIVLTALGNKEGLDDVIWGALNDCHLLQDDGAQQTVDGDIAVRYPNAEDILVAFSGTWLDAAGQPADLDIDFRVLVTEDVKSLATLQETDGGSFVVSVPYEGVEALLAGGEIAIQDENGTWSCQVGTDLKGGTCTHEGEEVQWDL